MSIYIAHRPKKRLKVKSKSSKKGISFVFSLYCFAIQ